MPIVATYHPPADARTFTNYWTQFGAAIDHVEDLVQDFNIVGALPASLPGALPTSVSVSEGYRQSVIQLRKLVELNQALEPKGLAGLAAAFIPLMTTAKSITPTAATDAEKTTLSITCMASRLLAANLLPLMQAFANKEYTSTNEHIQGGLNKATSVNLFVTTITLDEAGYIQMQNSVEVLQQRIEEYDREHGVTTAAEGAAGAAAGSSVEMNREMSFWKFYQDTAAPTISRVIDDAKPDASA